MKSYVKSRSFIGFIFFAKLRRFIQTDKNLIVKKNAKVFASLFLSKFSDVIFATMKWIYITILFGSITFACNIDREKVGDFLEQKIDKQFILPDSIEIGCNGCIVNYVDPSDCTACRLKIGAWKRFMADVNEARDDSTTLIFVLHPAITKQVVGQLFKREHFSPVIVWDNSNCIKGANSLGDDIRLHTFLLDGDGNILLVGNPVLNPKIKELYLNKLGESDSSIIKVK